MAIAHFRSADRISIPASARFAEFVVIAAILLGGLSGPLTRAQARPGGDEQFDRAVRLIQQATRARPDGEHLLLIRGLRQLHDPQLRPFFATLCQSDNPFIQVHAILETAYLSKTKRIDPWKLSKLKRVELRRGALAEAISQDFVGAEEYRAILEWPDLDDSIQSVALIMLVAKGETVDTEVLRKLMDDSDSPIVRARCAMALVHLGKKDGTSDALESLSDLPRSIREEAIGSLLSLIRNERLKGMRPWIQKLLKQDDLSVTLRLMIISVLLDLEPEAGRATWKETYNASVGLANKLRCALLLLSSADKVEPMDFAPLEGESFELLAAIGQAGSAVASGSPATEECLALLRFNHPLSAAWVLKHARTLQETDPEAATELFSALIEGTMEDGPSIEERLELAVRSAADLTKFNAARLRTLLNESAERQRRLTQEAILAGAWQSQSAQALELIDGISEWMSTRAGSIALLIKAEYAEVGTFSDDDLQRLSFVFGGAGHVSPGYQVQAAWLYLRHTGQEGAALASVLGSFSKKVGDG